MGFQHTWESLHISDMVRNFEYLRDQHIFEDVPVRDGHPGWLVSGMEGNGKVVGYHASLQDESRTAPHDGQEYNYLLADLEIIDADAMTAIESGLWRSVSSETGAYVTNNEAEYWPVYQGVAYCDIPAVEGLKGFSRATNSISVFTEGESAVAGENEGNTGGTTSTSSAPEASAATVGAGGAANSPDTNASAKTSADQTPNEKGVEVQAPPTGTPSTGGQPTAVTQATPGEGQHGRTGAFTFTIGGQQTTDFAAVQSHISTLEAAQHEAAEQARRDFVSSLALPGPNGEPPRMLGSQVDAQTVFALSLTSEQFENFKRTWDTAAPVSLLASHASGIASGDGSPGAPSKLEALQSELATQEDIMQHHRNAGKSEEWIAERGCFSKATALREQIAALTQS
jgi:hypothetical protein